MSNYTNATVAAVEKVKYVGDYTAELKESLAYNLDRAKLLTERLSPVLGQVYPSAPREKLDAEFPLGHELIDLLETSQVIGAILDDFVNRLRL